MTTEPHNPGAYAQPYNTIGPQGYGAPGAHMPYGGLERHSVRLIDAVDNQFVGQTMLQTQFYNALRVLDGEQFDVVVDGDKLTGRIIAVAWTA